MEIMDILLTNLIVVVFSWVYTSLQTHQAVYIIYLQLNHRSIKGIFKMVTCNPEELGTYSIIDFALWIPEVV